MRRLFLLLLILVSLVLLVRSWRVPPPPAPDRFRPLELPPRPRNSHEVMIIPPLRPGPVSTDEVRLEGAELVTPVATEEVPLHPSPSSREIELPPRPVPPPQSDTVPQKVGDIPVPGGCRRIDYPASSYAAFLRELPLRRSLKIETWNGGTVPDHHYRRLAVLDLPLLFAADLEQCADWAMRLRAEYFRRQGRLGDLILFRYDGSPRRYRETQGSWQRFLQTAFAHSNSHSLKQGCRPIRAEDLQPGDLIVQNETGGIGHVSVAIDACEDENKERYYLFGFSFMPAQAFHLENGSPPWGREGWFTLEGFSEFLRQNFPYGEPRLRRFPD